MGLDHRCSHGDKLKHFLVRPLLLLRGRRDRAGDATEQIRYFVPVHSSFGRRRVLASCCRHAWSDFHRRFNGGRERGTEGERVWGKTHSRGLSARKLVAKQTPSWDLLPSEASFLKPCPHQPGRIECENSALSDLMWQSIHCKNSFGLLNYAQRRTLSIMPLNQDGLWDISKFIKPCNVFGKD